MTTKPPSHTEFWHAPFTQRTFWAVGIVGGVILLTLFVWQVVGVLLLVFAAILLAVFIRAVVDLLTQYTPLSDRIAYFVALGLLVVAMGLSIALLAPALAQQAAELPDRLNEAWQQVNQRFDTDAWSEQFLNQAPQELTNIFANRGVGLLSNVRSIFAAVFNTVLSLLIIVFIGVLLAANPQRYMQGFLHLVPTGRRERVREVLHALGYTLRWWLVGRLVAMSVIGVLMVIGLWLIGVPFALALGILTGLLSFVPNIGAVLAIIPPLLLSITVSPITPVYVLAYYMIIQLIENYLITPTVQKRTIDLPPPLTVLAQVLMTVLVGGVLSLSLAVPLVAVTIVLVKMLYIQDVLGDDSIKVMGEDKSAKF